jgi:Condensation domain
VVLAIVTALFELADMITNDGLIRSIPRNGEPLSFAQQRLWFLDQLEPNRAIYNVSSGFRLTGPLGIDALERSLNEIIRRHEVLRTIFSTVDGQPVQVILPSLVIPLPLINISDGSERDQEHEVRHLCTKEAQRPFDLARGPLIRATLLRLDQQDHVLLLILHHIVSDGWSRGVLFRELSALYEAYSEGKASPLPALPAQYADFAIWQRQWMQGELLEKHLAYWKTRLAGAPPVLNLPTDHPRPMMQTFRGAAEQVALPKELTDELRALSRRENATLFMTLLAVFKVLLHRSSGQSDIVVGTDVANRCRLDIEGLIGFFVNTSVLRTRLSGNPTFRELLHRVREVALGAYEHQDLPFEKLVEELRPARSLSHHPLFQVMLVLHNTPGADLQLPGLAIRPVQLPVENVVFDLSLQVWETAEGLRCVLKYNTDLFEAATARRFLEDFEIVLRVIITRSETRLRSLIEMISQTGAHSTVSERQELKHKTLETLPFAQRKGVRLPEESKS